MEDTGFYCPHCGEYLEEQDVYRSYERKVARWIGGAVAPSHNESYDVLGCEGYPDLTFQVKYAKVYHYKGLHRNRKKSWNFNENRLGEADFYVLFGVADDGKEHCFLLTRQSWMDNTFKNHTGGRIMQMSCTRFSRRGAAHRSYIHEGKVWRYVVSNPEERLLGRIHFYADFNQLPLGI